MFNFIKNHFKNQERKRKISRANRQYFQDHGLTRRVPVREMDGSTSYIYLDRKSSFKGMDHLRKQARIAARERKVVYV